MHRTIFIRQMMGILCLIFSMLSVALAGDFEAMQKDIIFGFRGIGDSARIGFAIRGIGDLNGDGYDDIAVSSFNPVGVYIFLGGEVPDSIPDQFISFESFGSSDYPGIIAPLLRFDGMNPSLCLSGYSIKFYADLGDSFAALPFDSITSISGQFTIDPDFMEAGYVDDDSIADILTTEEGSSDTDRFQKVLLFLDPVTTDKNPDWVYEEQFVQRQILNQGLIDYNGDGNTDIFITINQLGGDTTSYVYLFYGPSFPSTPSLVIPTPVGQGVGSPSSYFAWPVRSLGDVDGDGWDDLGVRWGQLLIYKGGPSADSLFDYSFPAGYDSFGPAGDLNGDTWNDLAGGYGRVFFGNVDIYLGGNVFDTVYDLAIYQSDLPPVGTDEIGYRVTSAGDFNGDDFDDLIFSCKDTDPSARRYVFVIGGNAGILSPVGDHEPPDLPSTVLLGQNYPNPFNLSTVISFDIPRRTEADVTINNVLGQEVRLLWQGSLSAGRHELTWDGRDNHGKVVSSGVYYYRLSTDQVTETKKMLLIK